MEKCEGNQASTSISRKEKKKKKTKDEMDRIKQAEKKKRRIEKALATSAAIIFKLEKKKEREKEEQQRLDEEGAAIAKSVALHVLGDEDSDDAWGQTNMRGYMENSRSIGFLFDYQGHESPSFKGVGCVCGTYESGFNWGSLGIGCAVPSGIWKTSIHAPHLEETVQRRDVSSPGFVAAEAFSALQIEAFSALQIAESSYEMNGHHSRAVGLDRIMGSRIFSEEVKFYDEY